MKLTTYFGLGFIAVVLLMQRWDYSALGLFILGISFCIPEKVKLQFPHQRLPKIFFCKIGSINQHFLRNSTLLKEL